MLCDTVLEIKFAERTTCVNNDSSVEIRKRLF